MNKQDVGEKISAIRKEMGLTQRELAEKLHVTDKTISKWETGTHFPDIAIMEKLASSLGITVVELLGLERSSTGEVVDEISLIHLEEQRKLIRQIRNGGWSTVIRGVIVAGSLLYASKVMADSGLYGLPQVATMGMLGIVATMISDGISAIANSGKLLK